MIKTLIDYKMKEKFRVVVTNLYLPCFGEDGVVYFWLTNLYYGGSDIPRNDCRILDLEQKIGLKPMMLSDGVTIERWDCEGSKFKSLEDIENYINKK